MSEGFFNRWSERKRKASLDQSLPPEPLPAATPAAPQPQPGATDPAQSATPMPTLEQAQCLTPESDFSAFAARGVAPEVRNLAMKKLFGDPRFNVMDGMDVYIDDYSNLQPPTPEQMRSLVAAQTMQLFEAPVPQQSARTAQARTDSAPGTATSIGMNQAFKSSEAAVSEAAVFDPSIHRDRIVQTLRARLTQALAIYAFGSRISGTAGPDSDLDLAVLVAGYTQPLALFDLAGDLADAVHCSVDLLDLRAASTVMQYQIITTGQRWWARDAQAALFEAAVLSEKTTLDAARAGLLGDVERRGLVYGG